MTSNLMCFNLGIFLLANPKLKFFQVEVSTLQIIPIGRILSTNVPIGIIMTGRSIFERNTFELEASTFRKT